MTACTIDRPRLRDLRDWLTVLDDAGALVTATPGVPSAAVLERVGDAVANPIDWQLVDSDRAPVHEVTHRGDEIDLRRLMPIITCHEHDAGPYITSGLVNGRNLQTGKQNLSINRMQVHAPDRSGS